MHKYRVARLLLIPALLLGGKALAEPVQPIQPPTETTSDQSLALSQGDLRWKNLPLARGVSVGKAGCLFMSLFTSITQLGYRFDVPTFLQLLVSNRLFDRYGRFIWNVGTALPGLTAERLMLTGDLAISKALESLAAGKRVLVQVVTSRGSKHWVAALGTISGALLIADSDGGKVGTLENLYGAHAVTGLAVLTQA